MAWQGFDGRFVPLSVLHDAPGQRLLTALDLVQGGLVSLRQSRLGQADPGPMLARVQPIIGLAHPHLVGVRGAGLCGDTFWIAADLARGESLAEALRHDGRLPTAEAAGLVLQLLDGLAQLHARGVAHGGVAVGAILLEDAPGPGWLRLCPPEPTAPAADPAADLAAAGQVLRACLAGSAGLAWLEPVLAPARGFASASAMAEALRGAVRRGGASARPQALGALVRRAKARLGATAGIAGGRRPHPFALRRP